METFYKNPTPNSYWVIPDHLLAGEHPGIKAQKARETVQQLLAARVTVFIDLTRPGEAYDYENLLGQEAAKLRYLVAYYQMPIKDEGIPKPQEMVEILNMIDTAVSVGRKVYLHSLQGRGRAGTVIGCYLVRHGMSGQAALQEITRLRRSLGVGSPESSPHTVTQQQLVLGWREGR